MKDKLLARAGSIEIHKTEHKTFTIEIDKKIFATIDNEGAIVIWKDMAKKAGTRKTLHYRGWRFSLKPSWERG